MGGFQGAEREARRERSLPLRLQRHEEYLGRAGEPVGTWRLLFSGAVEGPTDEDPERLLELSRATGALALLRLGATFAQGVLALRARTLVAPSLIKPAVADLHRRLAAWPEGSIEVE